MATLAERVGSKAESTIWEYLVDLAPQKNGDVRVTMKITYEAYDEPKPDGFKFVGPFDVKDVSVTDSRGRTLRHKVERHRESMIHWTFREPVFRGRETAIVEFTLEDALGGDAAQTHLDAEWVGRFRIPVRRSTYRIVLPAGVQPASVRTGPNMDRKPDAEGRVVLEHTRDEPGAVGVSMWCEPGFATVRTRPRALARPRSAGELPGWVVALVIAGVVGFFSYVGYMMYKHGGRGGGGPSSSSSSSYDSDSSSWSSCSSSSCSSCGGSSCGGGGGCGGCGG